MRWAGAVVVLGVATCAASDVGAQNRGPRAEQPAERDDEAADRERPPMRIEVESSYGGFLALTYFVPVVGMLGPPVVHWLHGETGRGFGALGGMAGSILAGLVVGGAVAVSLGCLNDNSTESNGCMAGAVVGALAGYVAWGVHDSVNNSDYMRTLPVASPHVRPVPGGAVGGMNWRF